MLRPAGCFVFSIALLLTACAEPAGPAVDADPPPRATANLAAADNALVETPSPTASPAPPTATSQPTVTPTLADTATPTNTPPPTPTPVLINDMSLEEVLLLPEGVRGHIRQIADRGRALGRNPNAFARIGASVAATQHFMGRFDTGPYDLGPYDYLQPTIDQYAGSFSRVGHGAMRGLTTWAVFDPTWANADFCQPNESVIDCEIRLHNPSVIIVVLGTNDIGKGAEFESNMRHLLAYIIEQGIVPILATKSDRYEGADDRNNAIIRHLADNLQVPLWDFDLIAGTIPGRGMGSDGVHLTLYDQYDYTAERAFQRGYGVYNLTALMMLHAVREEITP